jgi:hypothetical protein
MSNARDCNTVKPKKEGHGIGALHSASHSKSALVLTLEFSLAVSQQSAFSCISNRMSMFDKFRKGAQKAGVQATSFVQRSSTQVASGAQGFAQTFNLPGESEKAANILSSFLGTCRL